MSEFPHLKFKTVKDNALYKVSPPRPRPSQQTIRNNNNRKQHGSALQSYVNDLSKIWQANIIDRKEQGLPEISNAIPVFLQIEPDLYDIEFLKGFGIEIISEEDNGFIIGASLDNFTSLNDKINKFIEEKHGGSKTATLWNIITGNQWRIEQILSEELQAKWDTIQDDDIFYLEIGIACYIKPSEYPKKEENESAENYEKKCIRWQKRYQGILLERDDLCIKREQSLENFIAAYDGELLSGYRDLNDSFCCKIKLSGKGLKDLVLNYQYIFEVRESDEIYNADSQELSDIFPDLTLVSPEPNSPKVCVIDSGINEQHKLIAPAMDTKSSMTYIPNTTTTADEVHGGGHGTRVAGAVLYSSDIPKNGTYQLPCFIQNAKILDGNNGLPSRLYIPEIIEKIANDFNSTRLFNMSVTSVIPCRLTHMSQWATVIDKLMFDKKDILFIIAAGNLYGESRRINTPGIKNYLNNNITYPDYLLKSASRIVNPAQSSFALTVGSVCIDKFDSLDQESFGEKDDPSSFSRTGLGLWGMIKPDVVEYGGDFVREKNSNQNLSTNDITSPELVKAGGNAIGRDAIGTSYAAPKVSHIAAHIQRLFPKEPALLYRALIAQSARLPNKVFSKPELKHIRHYGYGIPDLHRATENNPHRITLINSGHISPKQANIYTIAIPDELRRPGDEYDVLIEITLSYAANPRRTRRKTQSYLSTWLDWITSRQGESIEEFQERILKPTNDNNEDTTEDEDALNSIQWAIRERSNWGTIKNVKRQDSTLQKDWCIIKSNQLPAEFNLAIKGHKGWEQDLTKQVPYSLAMSFEILGKEIDIYNKIKNINANVIIEERVEQSIEI